MKQFHRFQKFMAALMVFAMLFGSVPAWAVEIKIADDGTVTGGYGSSYKGVDASGGNKSLGANVTKIYTTAEPSQQTWGIYAKNNYGATATSITNGIHINSGGKAYGIYAEGAGKTTVSGVGGITAKGAAYGYGIYSKGTGAGFENNVSFVSGSTINASGNNSGGRGIGAEGKGKTYVTNLGGITANSSSASAYGIYSCGSDTSFANNVSFSGTGSTITATGSGKQNYGIATYGTGTTTVSGLGGIYANTSYDGDNTAYGIYSCGSDASLVTNVTFADGGKIKATSPLTTSSSKNAYGICTENNGTTIVSNLSSVEAIGYKYSYGIRNGTKSGQDVKMNVTFADGGTIIATSAWQSSDVYGIYAQGKETTVSNLSSIESNGGNTVNGIYSCTSVGQVANVSFSSAGGYVNATSTGGLAYGIGAAEKGKSYVTNVGGITAKAKGSSAAYGISSKSNSGEGAENFDNNVSFVTTGGYVNASSAGGDAYGIYAYNYGKTTVSNVGSIEANSSGTEKKAYGIFGCGSNTSFKNNVSFASGGYVNATSAGGGAYGIGAFGNGTTTVSNLGGITAKSSSTFAFGIESYGSDAGFSNNVSFASGGTINATGTGGQAAGIFAHNDGKTYVSNLGGITAAAETNTNEVYGIKSSGRNGFVNNVSFVTTGGYINATNSKDSARGIHAQNYGTTTVTNVGDITVNGGKRAYGIYSGGSDKNFSNNVSFANGGTITATATGDNAYGMYSNGTGKTYVSNLGGITAETKASGYYAYGIYSNGTDANFSNNVSFKGNGGQAITAKAATPANAYSIYAFGNGATTVNFEDSILSGKIYQQGDATVTLNFGSNSSWTPAMGDVSGNVSVNMNSGSTLDTRVATRVATGVAENKTIDLGGGKFTAVAGSKISFDAKTEPIGLTTDQIKAAKTSSGTIELGTVNVIDTATSAWTKPKYATLFVDSDSKALTGIQINGSTTTATDNGYIYTFTGVKGGAGNVSATSEADVNFTLPELIQGIKEDKGKSAGTIETFSITQAEGYSLNAELGTLNNNQREQFTIYGNGYDLSANTSYGGGVTINSGDTMNVTNVTVSGFTQFATNAGTLNLDKVTFSGTTGNADVINNGTLNLNTTATTFDKGVSGNGTTNVNVDTDMKTAALSQDKVTVADGITLTTAGGITAAKGIANNGTLSLGGGTADAVITGTGTTEVTGVVSMKQNIAQTVALKDGANLSFANGKGINATVADSDAYGITAEATGTMKVSNLGGIEANTSGNSKSAYGIYSCGSDATGFENNVSFAAGGKITATATGTEGNASGIYAQGTGTTTVSGLGGITANGVKSASGIYALGTGTTTVSDLGDIEANCNKYAYGIYSCGSDANFSNNVSFANGGKITATSASRTAYGIGAFGNGTTTVSNLGGITAEAKGNSAAYGIYSGGSDANFSNNVSFVNGGKINASSTGDNAYGISAVSTGTMAVSNLGSIEANSSGTKKNAYGIYSRGSDVNFSSNVSFANGGKITATATAGDAYGIGAYNNGTTTVSNLGGIEANGSANAYGIYSCGSDTGVANNVSFVATGGYINATSTGDKSTAYGIYTRDAGTTTVNNISGIDVNSSSATGITSNSSENKFSFVGEGSYVNVTGITTASGIKVTGTGTATVTGLGTITVTANGDKANAYGIYNSGSATTFNSNITFANGGTIATVSGTSGNNAYGVYAVKNGTTTVSNVGGITAETKASGANAYGIYSNGTADTFANNVSFKGNGGQAITAKAATAENAYSIYAINQGATTVSFEDSILSGKVVQSGDATLTLNFGSNSSWKPTGSGVSGNVSVNMNSGSTLDTRVATGKALNKTIDLGTGTFTAQQGSKINFDAVTEDKGLTTDQIKAESKSGGTIELGTVNVKDSATLTWIKEKNANLFVDSADTSQGLGISINGTTTTVTDNGYTYTFTGGKNGNVSATSEATGYTLPEVIQANPQEAGVADAFSLFNKGDVKLKEDMGTLNNQYRQSGKREFTIYGNNRTLYANDKGGVTINAGDTMTVKELTAKDFGQFATNAGTLNLDGVTFSGTTGTADVTNSGTLNLDGTNTFVKGIAGNGTTNVNADTDMGSTTLEQGETNVAAEKTLTVAAANLKSNVKNSGTVKLGAGTLGDYNIEGGKIVTGGNTNASVTNLLADDVYNKYTLTLTGTGTLNENIWDEGGVKGTVKMNAKEITVAASKTIENNIEYLGTEATNVELKDGSTIAGTVKAPEGSKIIVDGNGVTNAADQTLDVVVNETKDLTTTKKLAGNITLMEDAELTATASGAKLGNGSATNISVGKNAKLTALATNINADIYNASDKSVHLTGGTLSKNIRESGTTYIEGDTTFANGITVENKVYVDNGKSLSAANAFTLANTLYFEGGDKQSTVTNVSTTGTLAFVLTGANKDKAIVKATNGYNITGAKVALYQADEALYDRLDVVKLMEGATGSYANQLIKAQDENSVVLKHKYSTYLEGEELLAKYLGSGATEEAKSFSEGRLAGVATLTQSSDLLAGAGMASAVAAAKASANGAAPFVEISGAHGRYDTGSHIDLNSLNVVAGIAQKVNDCVTAGTYIEGGNGRYASYNEFATGDIRADGDINYFGAGVFGRYDFNKTDKGNAYVDGAIGAGYTSQDYATDSALVDNARYDASSSYFKAHATVGYEWKLAKGSIDGYAKYLWVRQGADSVTVGTDPINFDSINSNRLRAGFRYTQGIKKTLAWYGGLAYEYEFSAKAKASSYGFAIGEPDLIGGSGMAELGLKFAPLNAHGWRFDAGLQGFTGKRDSLGVRLGAWYEF